MAAGKAGRSGRKSKREDAELLEQVAEALANEPPPEVVRSWKDSVRRLLSRRDDDA